MLAHITVNGIVQGVGFRPFVYRLSKQFSLKGYILNLGNAGVEIEVEGEKKTIEKFIQLLIDKKPPLAEIEDINVKWNTNKHYKKFEIKESREEQKKNISVIPPDIAICDECIDDIKK